MRLTAAALGFLAPCRITHGEDFTRQHRNLFYVGIFLAYGISFNNAFVIVTNITSIFFSECMMLYNFNSNWNLEVSRVVVYLAALLAIQIYFSIHITYIREQSIF